MTKKRYYQIAGAVLIVLIAGFLLFKKHGDNTIQNSNLDTNENTQNQEQIVQPPTGQNSQTLEGTLKASNNSKKGNLMLMTKDHTIYLNTSRDFTKLIGKEVVVNYSGTLDYFVLGNIVEK